MSTVSPATSIRRFVRVVLRQLSNDRSALVFMLVLPVAIIVVVGTSFGTDPPMKIGVTGVEGSATAEAIVDGLDRADGVEVVRYDSVADLERAVRRYATSAGVAFGPGFDDQVVAGTAEIRFVSDPLESASQVARDVFVSAATPVLAPIDAARAGATATGASYDEALSTASALSAVLRTISVETDDVGERRDRELSQFSLTAPQNLVLFVFINAMASGTSLVRMRRTGVLRRVLAGPVGTPTIIVGLVAAWFVVSLVQSGLILAVGGVVFDVDWGDPVGAAALVVVFALVGGGAGLLVGALGGDEDRVGAISPPVGIALGALGGCMMPVEIFPPVMRTVAHAVPHYWAMTAWQQLVFDGDGVAALAGPLAVLAGFATVLLGTAAWALHRALVRA